MRDAVIRKFVVPALVCLGGLSVGTSVLAEAATDASVKSAYVVKAGDTLDKVVRQAYPNSPLREQLLSDALKSTNPQAFLKGKPNVLLAGAMLKVPNHVAMLEQQYKLFSAPAPGEDASEDSPRKWVRFP